MSESLSDLVQKQAQVIASLEARVFQLEGSGKRRIDESRVSIESAEEVDAFSRRRILKGAALAIGSGVLLGTSSTQPADAATGGNVVLGNANDANAPTVLRNTTGSSPANVVEITNTAGGGLLAVGQAGREGLAGRSDGSNLSVGTQGISDIGYGIYGQSNTGYGVYVGGNGRFGMKPHTPSGPPTAGSYTAGDIVRDNLGNMFLCVTTGSPGLWRRAGGPSSAGQFEFLPNVIRAVSTLGGPGITPGTLAVNTNRATTNLATVLSIPVTELGGALLTVTAYPPGAGGVFPSSGYVSVSGTYTATPSVTFAGGTPFQTGLVASSFNVGTLVVAAFGAACEVTIDVVGVFR